MRNIIYLVCFYCTQLSPLYAHIGSPGIVMQGNAGEYRVIVSVTPPNVIPGLAKVTVFLENGMASSIILRTVYFETGEKSAAKGEIMNKVAGVQNQYTAETWLMVGGSSSMQISINGSLGKGQLVVPVVAAATARKTFPASTGWALSAAGIFLFILLLTIVNAAVSDAVTKKNEQVTERRKRMRWVSMTITAILTLLIVYGGNAWWQFDANNYKKFMFKPTKAFSKVKQVNGSYQLIFTLDTNSQRHSDFSYIIPDHGKMMHMFLMKIPAMNAFAHMHPHRLDSVNYLTNLPPLPKGKYLTFADIVYNNGFTETIKDTFEIKDNISNSFNKLDVDDAFAFAIPANIIDNPQLGDAENTIICGKPGTGVKLKDGSVMIWEGMTNEPLVSNKLYSLKFTIVTADKKPALLEPYLGMAGHAAIVRNDGNVYIHLHPVGTYSMAAETNFLKRISDRQGMYQHPDRKKFYDSIDAYVKNLSELNDTARDKILMQQMMMPKMTGMKGMENNNSVEFPYSFPEPGQYRIWVQVKRNKQVLTAAFDKIVD